MQLDILLKWNSLIILVEKNEAASDKRSTERVIGIVARDLRNTRYGVCFLAENELPHVLRKSLTKYSPFQILYQTWYLTSSKYYSSPWPGVKCNKKPEDHESILEIKKQVPSDVAFPFLFSFIYFVLILNQYPFLLILILIINKIKNFDESKVNQSHDNPTKVSKEN